MTGGQLLTILQEYNRRSAVVAHPETLLNNEPDEKRAELTTENSSQIMGILIRCKGRAKSAKSHGWVGHVVLSNLTKAWRDTTGLFLCQITQINSTNRHVRLCRLDIFARKFSYRDFHNRMTINNLFNTDRVGRYGYCIISLRKPVERIVLHKPFRKGV